MIGGEKFVCKRSVTGQRNVTFDTVGKGQAWGHSTPDVDALSGRGITERNSQRTVAGSPSCASLALRRRLIGYLNNTKC